MIAAFAAERICAFRAVDLPGHHRYNIIFVLDCCIGIRHHGITFFNPVEVSKISSNTVGLFWHSPWQADPQRLFGVKISSRLTLFMAYSWPLGHIARFDGPGQIIMALDGDRRFDFASVVALRLPKQIESQNVVMRHYKGYLGALREAKKMNFGIGPPGGKAHRPWIVQKKIWFAAYIPYRGTSPWRWKSNSRRSWGWKQRNIWDTGQLVVPDEVVIGIVASEVST